MHPWGCRPGDPETPDQVTFDLDPDTAIDFAAVIAAAKAVKARLEELGLTPFVKTLTMYETPTETHLRPGETTKAFTPNEFVDITDHFATKLSAWAQYESQHLSGYGPRSPDALTSLAGFRGAYIGVRYAEAFQLLFRRS